MNSIIGRQNYRLLNLIGEGSLSQVYKALRSDSKTSMKEIVAIKLLKSKNLVSIWKQEYKTLRKVQSAYCVRALSFEWIHSCPALIMDYVDGVSLFELLKKEKINLEEIRYIEAKLEKALLSLHKQKIIHGDLSPKNILIDKNSKLWLIDYGLQGNFQGNGFVTKGFCHPDLLGNHKKPCKETDKYSAKKVIDFLLSKTNLTNEINQKKSSLFSKKDLGEKVSRILSRRIDLEPTEKINSSKKSFFSKIIVILSLATLSALPSQSSKLQTQRSISKVSVRTHKTFKIYVNNKFIGYSPLSFYFYDPSVKLKAVSGGKIFKKILNHSPLAHRILNDIFFTQKK